MDSFKLSHLEKLTFSLLFLGALIARFVFFEERLLESDFFFPQLDSLYHHHFAKGYALGDWQLPAGVSDPALQTTPYHRPPGYPYFLTLVYLVIGSHPLAIAILQSILVFASAALAFTLLKKAMGPSSGIYPYLAATLILYQPTILYFEGERMGTVCAMFTSILGVCTFWKSLESRSHLFGFASGLCFGCGILIRPNLIFFVGGILLWRVLQIFHLTRVRLPKALQPRFGLLPFILGVCLCLGPVLYRNAEQGYVGISTNGAITLLHGNHSQADGILMTLPDQFSLRARQEISPFTYPTIVEELAPGLSNDVAYREANRKLISWALQYAVDDPVSFLNLSMRKFVLLFGPREIGNNKELELERENHPVLKYFPFRFSVMLALFIFSIAIVYRHRKSLSESQQQLMGLTFFFFLGGMLFLVPFLAAGRLRVPFLWVMAVWAALGLGQLRESMLRARWRKVSAQLAAILGLLLICSHPWVTYTPHEDLWHIQKGRAHNQAGREQAALEAFQKAIRLNPDSTAGYLARARLQIRKGDYQDALRDLNKPLRAGTDHWEIYAHAGMALAQVGRLADAEASVRRALELAPKNGPLLYNLGLILERNKSSRRAIQAYRDCLAIESSHYRARLNLGRLLLIENHLEEALRQFQKIKPTDENYTDALFNSGVVFMKQERWPEALKTYETLENHSNVPPKAQRAKILTNKGASHFALGRLRAAAEDYRKSLLFSSEHVGTILNFARTLRLLGEFDRAEEELSKLLRKAEARPANPKLVLMAKEELVYLIAVQGDKGKGQERMFSYSAFLAAEPSPFAPMALLSESLWWSQNREPTRAQNLKEKAIVLCKTSTLQDGCQRWEARHQEMQSHK
jgi:tetratricopeptide (TPR) repeat protein